MNERTDWLTWRRQGIGASDVAALMGLSPWASPWSVWADKVGLTPLDDDDVAEHLETGRWLELAIGPWFVHETGLTIAGEQMRCHRPESPHHRCTVDGLIVETDQAPSFLDDALGVLEIKHEAFGRPWETIPAHYQCQAQWALHVTGLGVVHFAVLHGRRLRHYELERDDADIALLIETADAFWHEHVIPGVPPTADSSPATTRAIAQVYPGGEPDAVDIAGSTVREWLEAKSAHNFTTSLLEQCENKLKAELGDHEAGSVDGQVAVTWRRQSRRGDLDVAALEADGVEVEKYRKPSTNFRVLRAVAPRKERS